MFYFLNDWSEYRRLACERLRREWVRRGAIATPAEFRRRIRLDAGDEQTFDALIEPWQERDFAALDAGWMQLAGMHGDNEPRALATGSADDVSLASRPEAGAYGSRQASHIQRTPHARDGNDHPVQRAYLERARGHSKTSDIAVQVLWILLSSKRTVSGLAAAADRDQARLILRAIRRIARANPKLCGHLQFVENRVRNPRTHSQLEVISSDVGSSWGALPDFVICDELCHWSGPELWHSLLSSAAKKADCMLVVLSNAGIGRSWQWDVREHARLGEHWYFSTVHGPQAKWMTDIWLKEQRSLLPGPVFARLWLNEWQHSDGEFVTLDEARACRDARLVRQEKGDRRVRYVAAIDYAEKRDYTVGCVCHHDGLRIVVDRMDVVQPGPHRPTPVEWVEDWIGEVAAKFHRPTFIVDEHQLVGTVQKLEQRHNIRRFDFGSGRGNHRLAVHLRQLITHRSVAWYPGCGAITRAGPGGRDGPGCDDLETELASLLLRETTAGRLRIDHLRDGEHHDDRAFTLGTACLYLSEHATRGDDLFILTPPVKGGFVW